MTTSARSPAPIYFGDEGARLFGWIHHPEQRARPTAVVLCNPLGDDYVRAHRSLRHLAEDLCAAGFPVLRFDFHGTGDSAGHERDPGRVAAWRRDLGTAIDELRRQSGAAKVAIVGLRFGATIAADVASQRDDVASVVLWHPFLDGSTFTSETLRVHRMHRMLEPASFAAGPTEYADGEEALGFFLTKETIADLKGLNLMALPRRPAPQVLVVGAANVPAEGPLLDHLRGLGAEVAYHHLPGHKFLISIPHRSTVPQEVIDTIVSWLAETHPTLDASAPRPVPVPHPGRHASAQFIEEPLVFGTTHRLFGILVTPARDRARSNLPGIIMINAGTVHRVGPHRLYVELARELAELGFHVLRMDLSGIGDSPVASGDENLTYPATCLADCQAAMIALGERFGAQRFIVTGLCSGADIAFKLGMNDRRVAGVVMMNPLTFCVQDPAFVEGYKGSRYYQTFLTKQKWVQLFNGELDLVHVAKMVGPKVKGLAARILDRVRPKSNGDGHADVPAYLRQMAERGVDTFLLTTLHDPGVDYVDVHFGKRMKELAVANYRREDLVGTDHTFTSVWSRQHVRTTIREHLANRHLT